MTSMLSRLFFGNKRSIRFYKYFLSYVILVIILLPIIGSVVNDKIISVLQNEVENANVTTVSQIRDTMDLRLRELQRIALQISANPLLTPYMLTQSGYESYMAVSELGKYRSSNSFISNIVLTYNHKDNNQLYAATGVYGKTEFFSRIYKFSSGWGSGELTRNIESMTEPAVRPVETVYLNAATEARFATYIYPLPANSGKPYGAVIFLLDEKMLQAMTDHLLKSFNAYFYVLDGQRHPIFTQQTEDERDGAAVLEALQREPGGALVHVTRVGDKDYTVINLPSAYNLWSFLTVIPESQFSKKVQQSRRLFGIALLAILITGIALSFLLANNNYKKLRQLVMLYSEKKGLDVPLEQHMDEIAFLSKVIREGSYEDSVMLKLNSKTGIIRENVLVSLLKGKQLESDDVKQMLHMSGIRWEYRNFVTLLFVIDDYSAFESRYSSAIRELFTFSIINVAEELSQEIGKGYGTDLGQARGVAFLLNVKDSASDKEMIRLFAEKTRDFFKTYYKFTLSVGVGRVYNELKAVCPSYSEAQRALFYRFVKGNEQVLFYEDLNITLQQDKISYPAELEEQLLRSIRQGSDQQAEKLLQCIFEFIQAQELIPEKAQATCFGLVNTLMKTCDELQGLNRFRQKLEQILSRHHETISGMERDLIEICNELCRETAMRKESKNFGLRDQVLDYIHERYPDNSLSLDHIAEHFHMSPSYLTRFFKDHTGYSLIRYLDMLRMSKAKELLRTADQPLHDILNQVGYVDVSNFVRKFKKLEGITPLQYRNISSQQPQMNGSIAPEIKPM